MPGRRRLVILMYHRVLEAADPLRPHDVTLAEFAECMRYLKRFFNVLELGEAADRLVAGRLPSRAVAITFDDGYADNALVAGPVLQRLGLPATVFVATGFLDGGRMWNDTVIEGIRGARGPTMELGEFGDYPLADDADRAAAVAAVLPQLKHLPLHDRQQAADRIGALSETALPEDLMMTSGQVGGLASLGISVGAHTVSHPILSRRSPAEAAADIADSKSALESICGRTVDLFAYPNGRPGDDYRSCDVAAVARAGFRYAVTTSWGSAGRDSEPLQLPRINPWDRKGWQLALRVLRAYAQPSGDSVAAEPEPGLATDTPGGG